MDFGSEIPTEGPVTVEMVNATKESFDEDNLAKFQELLLDAKKQLYKGCPDFTKLSAIVKLLNLKGKYGASDKFFTELLGLLKRCYLLDNKELIVCRTCGISRWKVDNKTHKVYENIPAKACRTIDEKFPEIAKDSRNLRLGISADGVDVNSGTRHHSVCLVLSVIYNLPPWLCMKRKFIMLSVLISGYLGNDIDVFLEPLVDDLHTLFETGVDTYDASTKENFNLRAILLWTIMITLHLVERELAISEDSVSKSVRWISYGPHTTIVKYEAYNINGYTFHMKSNDGIVYQNSVVSVEAVDLHISKEVATTRKAFYYGVLQ
nr:hypothetical protein [Tanacetum cinerariifolium]